MCDINKTEKEEKEHDDDDDDDDGDDEKSTREEIAERREEEQKTYGELTCHRAWLQIVLDDCCLLRLLLLSRHALRHHSLKHT